MPYWINLALASAGSLVLLYFLFLAYVAVRS